MIAISLCGAAALSGCKVGPKYTVPVAPTPSAYKEAPNANDAAWQQAQPLDALTKGTWWAVFHDPGLDALEPQVETANQQLKQADANLRGAQAAVRVRNSDKYPTLGIAPLVGGERLSANQPYFNSANANNGVANLLLPLQASWEIDLWG
ncbi:MAG: RND transporter, partial [Bryocella sp.]